jgi:carnitine-CoA ligase
VMAPLGCRRPAGAAGLVLEDYFELGVVDLDTDDRVAVGQAGEAVIRPKQPWIISDGYYGAAELTASSRRNLWFHTGDLVRQDDQGWVYFIDRSADRIRRRGHNVGSAEVEQAVIRVEGVVEAAAVGIPSEFESGEDEILLVIVPDRSSSLAWETIRQACQSSLPQYAIPQYAMTVDTLPKTESGKIRRDILKQHANECAPPRLASLVGPLAAG